MHEKTFMPRYLSEHLSEGGQGGWVIRCSIYL